MSVARGLAILGAMNEHVERYREALEAWNRRDLVWILEQAAPDFEFHTAQLFPGIEPVYEGRDGMVEFWTTFIEEPWALFGLDVNSLEPAGDDRVLALLTFHGTERDSGEEVELPYAHLATFRDDEVVRIDAFADWDEARAAAGTAG
jgi:ketosteroid isomerase-like protein